MTGYRHHAEQFLLLLTALEQRALLENFRRIYFDYALTVDVVADLLQQKHGRLQTIVEKIQDNSSYVYNGVAVDLPQHLFVTVAQRTPIGLDPAEWPPFETFAHHFLLYTSKNAIDIRPIDLKTLQKSAVVYDIVYKPLITNLLKAAEDQGNKIVTGIGMLAFQGAIGFENWFHQKPEINNKLLEFLTKESAN